MIKSTFAVLGGDKRQVALAESLLKDGYTVFTSGLEMANLSKNIKKSTLQEAIAASDYVVLPLPSTVDYKSLNAPFSDKSIVINEDFIKLLKDKKVFCALKSKLLDISNSFKNIDLVDYTLSEDFAIKNAIPTSEGAIAVAIKEYESDLHGSNCLVTGFGRIGKVLANMLKGIGADVTVSARKEKDLIWIKNLGYKAIRTNSIKDGINFDIIFNTVPFLIFDSQTLAKFKKKSLIIDLASSPGAVDKKAANRMNIKVIHALGLPGKFSPVSSAEIIKQTIYKTLEEETI